MKLTIVAVALGALTVAAGCSSATPEQEPTVAGFAEEPATTQFDPEAWRTSPIMCHEVDTSDSYLDERFVSRLDPTTYQIIESVPAPGCERWPAYNSATNADHHVWAFSQDFTKVAAINNKSAGYYELETGTFTSCSYDFDSEAWASKSPNDGRAFFLADGTLIFEHEDGKKVPVMQNTPPCDNPPVAYDGPHTKITRSQTPKPPVSLALQDNWPTGPFVNTDIRSVDMGVFQFPHLTPTGKVLLFDPIADHFSIRLDAEKCTWVHDRRMVCNNGNELLPINLTNEYTVDLPENEFDVPAITDAKDRGIHHLIYSKQRDKLVFMANRAQETPKLYEVGTDGGEPTRLTEAPDFLWAKSGGPFSTSTSSAVWIQHP